MQNVSLIDEWSLFGRLSDQFFIRLLIDSISISVLVWLIYYRIYRKSDFTFAFYMFNITLFTLNFLLNHVGISLAAALGLFAVFSMLRYRTESIGTKDMTYLFISIAMGLFCSFEQRSILELISINSIVVLLAFILDGKLVKNENVQQIIYERIDLIRSDKYDEMLKDLRNRTGLNIHKASVEEIDFEKGYAIIHIFFYDKILMKAKTK